MRFWTLLPIAGLAAGLAGCAGPHAPAPLYTVRFPDVKLQPGEYIQHIQLNITGGHVVTVNRLLPDWDTEIYWDNPSLQFVTGEARHFSSGLANLHDLDGFVTIAAEPAPGHFDLNAVLATESTTPTGNPDRSIVLPRAQLILQPARQTLPPAP